MRRAVSFEARLDLRVDSLFMASRLTLASSSLWPPLRNTMPGTAAGTVRCSARTVELGDLLRACWRGVDACAAHQEVLDQLALRQQPRRNASLLDASMERDIPMTSSLPDMHRV